MGVAVDPVTAFVERWARSGAAERANYQIFLVELCDLIGAPHPHPATPDNNENAYVFERTVYFTSDSDKTTPKFIDLYKRGCFVLEAKQGADSQAAVPVPLSDAGLKARSSLRHGTAKRGTGGWDDAMLRAKGQADLYIRALPAAEGRPPFLIVVDVGHCIEVYSEFSCTGGTYVPFPSAATYRIHLRSLEDERIRERLRLIWTDPHALDPTKRSAKVTREIAQKLGALAASLEQAGHEPKTVAAFLMRCLFTMFAEDVFLLPKDSFKNLLKGIRETPALFGPMVEELWAKMNTGGVSVSLRLPVLQFNGGLFADNQALPLNADQLQLLIEASGSDWRDVEPAIFGTLLERALDTRERHKLGAHYTPRAYVERLVLPTVVEPIRRDWEAVHAAAVNQANQGEIKKAVAEVKAFHRQLCGIRILDPACGSGNFLYVALEHLKRIEGEVFDTLDRLGDRQGILELAGHTVDPHQLLGIEINPRAAAIAELVLWIGALQWHFRNRGAVQPPQPIIRNFHNIECRDAVLAYDAKTPRRVNGTRGRTTGSGSRGAAPETPLGRGAPSPDPTLHVAPPAGEPAAGAVALGGASQTPARSEGQGALGEGEAVDSDIVTVWDGHTMKVHPVTGRDVPDETARIPVFDYSAPRRPDWPAADYIVGNPPFIGASRMRDFLGDGYTEAIRGVWKNTVPESADFVMHWWCKAAELLAAGQIKRFGLITTNSIHQTFNRRVVERYLDSDTGILPVSSAQGETGFQPVKKAATGKMPVSPLHLAFAIPDHPWVDSADGAAVRIAMTVAAPGKGPGILATVTSEVDAENGETVVTLATQTTTIAANLRGGADLTGCGPLQANSGISCPGVKLHGAGFIITPEQAVEFACGSVGGADMLIREYRNGKDLTDKPRGAMVIDAFGLSDVEFRERFPAAYQHVLTTVKPERDQNKRDSYRKNWWIFGEPRGNFRPALANLQRYIATVETSKHRFFTFLDKAILPDNMLVNIADDDAWILGVLSSGVHVRWALRMGGRLGYGNDPRYNKSRCFETFPFPAATEAQKARIRELGEQLDAHRKRQQAQHPDLTLTGMYNVLEKLRTAQPLTAKEKKIHDDGLVSVLKQLHDDLDRAVLEAYGWADLSDRSLRADGSHGSGTHAPGTAEPQLGKDQEKRPGKSAAAIPLADRLAAGDSAAEALEQEILSRLVALNHERAAEEARGQIRWLRPEYQAAGRAESATALDIAEEGEGAATVTAAKPVKLTWPGSVSERIQALRAALAAQPGPATAEILARQFNLRKPAALEDLLDTLVDLGFVRRLDADRYEAAH